MLELHVGQKVHSRSTVGYMTQVSVKHETITIFVRQKLEGAVLSLGLMNCLRISGTD